MVTIQNVSMFVKHNGDLDSTIQNTPLKGGEFLRCTPDRWKSTAVWLVSSRTTVWPAAIWPLARQAATREAIEELGRALDFGYDDFGHLDNDPDLDSLRKLPAYRKLMRQHGHQS
jgi:hypothetical protein